MDGNRGERVFEYYEEFPPEIRSMIIFSMHPADRCRFTRCSKLSRREATSSKNYIHSIKFIVWTRNCMKISVSHGDLNIHGPHTGYIMGFRRDPRESLMIYRNHQGQQLWWKPIQPENWYETTEVVEHAFKNFRELMTLHQNKVRILSIESHADEIEMNVDHGITRMNNLKELVIEGNFDFQQIISKAQRPLKTLKVLRNNFFENSLEQIIGVQENILYENLKLNNEQFLQLSASVVHIHIGQMTVMDVVNFLRSWKNGTVGRKLREVFWKLQNANFDTRQLFRTLGYDSSLIFRSGATVVVRHSEDARKSADVKFINGELKVFFHGDFDGA